MEIKRGQTWWRFWQFGSGWTIRVRRYALTWIGPRQTLWEE